MVSNLFSYLNPFSSDEENVDVRRKAIKSFKAKADAKRTGPEKFADMLTAKFGSIAFLSLNATWFTLWILMNVGWIPGIEPFDPFPFGLLTMVVSLEAIFLAIIVLISQNREARIAELREEIELQIGTVSESELTKLIKMVTILLEKQGVKTEDDPELQRMLKPFRHAALERELEDELKK
ncbi:MAG: DUF1003 domain-containing protein [Patescibacteria group bacterium]